MKKIIIFLLPIVLTYLYLNLLFIIFTIHIGLPCGLGAGAITTGEFIYDKYFPFPYYVYTCGSATSWVVFYLGTILNIVYYALLYVSYFVLVIKYKYSIKVSVFLNFLILVLHFIIYFVSKSIF